jgi:hypothetical protein
MGYKLAPAVPAHSNSKWNFSLESTKIRVGELAVLFYTVIRMYTAIIIINFDVLPHSLV